jgi:hypothetical protein
MLKRLTMPTELEVLAIPPLALLSVTEVSLSMMAAAIHCEHLDLDEIPRYFADGLPPPKSLTLARTICDRAEELICILDAYRAAVHAEIAKLTKTTDLPF